MNISTTQSFVRMYMAWQYTGQYPGQYWTVPELVEYNAHHEAQLSGQLSNEMVYKCQEKAKKGLLGTLCTCTQMYKA